MNQQNNQDGGLQLDWRKDTVWFLQILMLAVFSAAAPFFLLWTPPGWIGRRTFGFTDLIGLAFIYPLFGQWPSGPGDARLFNLTWAGLWILLVIQAGAAAAGNRKNRVHAHDIGSKAWIGRAGNPVWPFLCVSLPALLFLNDR